MKYDLHTHTNHSDGKHTPEVLLSMALEQQIDYLAITDHDTVSALLTISPLPKDTALTIVPGIELSTSWNGQTIHIVGLMIDPHNKALLQGTRQLQAARVERAEAIGYRFAKKGMGDVMEGARKKAGMAGISRVHFAQYLIEAGYVKDFSQAFKRYLGKNKSAYVATRWISISEAIQWIHDAGGQAVLAHPQRYRLRRKRLQALVNEFKAAKGNGIELSRSHPNDPWRDSILEWSTTYNLPISLGSDFHGEGMGYAKLGYVATVPEGTPMIWDSW